VNAFSVAAVEEDHRSDRISDLVDPEKSQIPRLGILGVGVDKQTEAMFPNPRGPYGVFVAARSEASTGTATGLQVGDLKTELSCTIRYELIRMITAMRHRALHHLSARDHGGDHGTGVACHLIAFEHRVIRRALEPLLQFSVLQCMMFLVSYGSAGCK
jgi:hypothetical protein